VQLRWIGAYLRSHELRSTTEGASCRAIPHFFLAETVIRDFNMSIKSQKNIVQLKISIYDTVLMEILQSQANFGSVEPDSLESDIDIDKRVLAVHA
jgi:hypothetical protein